MGCLSSKPKASVVVKATARPANSLMHSIDDGVAVPSIAEASLSDMGSPKEGKSKDSGAGAKKPKSALKKKGDDGEDGGGRKKKGGGGDGGGKKKTILETEDEEEEAEIGNFIQLGGTVPDFTADTNTGTIRFHEHIRGQWSMLFTYPSDFSGVSLTELSEVCKLQHEFDLRGIKVCAMSCNDPDTHKYFIKDIEDHSGTQLKFPIISDVDRMMAVQWGMVDGEEKSSTGMPTTCRAVFIIGPRKTLKLSIFYPASTGRSFAEILRVIDSLQRVSYHPALSTPAGWQTGDDVMMSPEMSTEDLETKYGGSEEIKVSSGKRYVIKTKDPGSSVTRN